MLLEKEGISVFGCFVGRLLPQFLSVLRHKYEVTLLFRFIIVSGWSHLRLDIACVQQEKKVTWPWMSDQPVVGLRSPCENQISSKCQGWLFPSVSAWPGNLFPPGYWPPSLCSFTLLCFGRLTSTLASSGATCSGTPFLPCDLSLNRNRIGPFHTTWLVRRQAYSDAPYWNLEGPRHPQLLFLPKSPQFINLQSAFILQSCYRSLLSISSAPTWGQTTGHFHWLYQPPGLLAVTLTLTTPPLPCFQNNCPQMEIQEHYCPPLTLCDI